MSDVPELDRLLEEHVTFQSNMRWYRTEQQMAFWLRLVLAALAAIPVCMASVVLGLVVFGGVFKVLQFIIPQPKMRDPFVRYRSM